MEVQPLGHITALLNGVLTKFALAQASVNAAIHTTDPEAVITQSHVIAAQNILLQEGGTFEKETKKSDSMTRNRLSAMLTKANSEITCYRCKWAALRNKFTRERKVIEMEHRSGPFGPYMVKSNF